jgi:DNA-directed RNA polymerase subunit RPC12/RpoP
MRRNRRVDPKSFDLTTECPECHYKVLPNEVMRLDSERMRCPSCGKDVLLPKTSALSGTGVPLEQKEG